LTIYYLLFASSDFVMRHYQNLKPPAGGFKLAFSALKGIVPNNDRISEKWRQHV